MSETNKPVTDLSQRVVSLARRIDRLPPGRYVIELVKPDLKAEAWQASVTRSETIYNLLIQKED